MKGNLIKKVYRLLSILHAFVGIGAMAGGMMAILNPEGPGGMATTSLNNSPFRDFLIPGIILFTVIGLGNVLCVLSIRIKSKYQGYISSIISWALVIWIIVQCIMLQTIVSLHVIFFIIGLVEAFLSFIILFAQRLFPVNVALEIISKIGEKYPDNIIIKSIQKFERQIEDLYQGLSNQK
jgi:hypothetical protein